MTATVIAFPKSYRRQLDWYGPQVEKLQKLNALQAEIESLEFHERARVIARMYSEMGINEAQAKCSRETFLDLLKELDKAKAAWSRANRTR